MFNINELINSVKKKDFWIGLLVSVFFMLVLAVNYNLFLLHNDLVIGGASGLGVIIYEYFGIQPGTFILLFNVLIISLSYFLLGPKETSMTIIGSILYPIFVTLTGDICREFASKIVLDNFILVVLICGIIYGVGNGIIYRTGYSTGGMDNVFSIISKYFKMPTGSASLIVNIIIIALGAMVFGVSKAIYAVIIIIINSFLVDKIMLGISDSKMFYITTKKETEVKKAIKELKAGYTILKTEGGYTNEKSDIIMCVVPTSQYFLFKKLVETIDPSSFIIISDCYEVYGGRRQQRFPFI